jgi:hypothetical protein
MSKQSTISRLVLVSIHGRYDKQHLDSSDVLGDLLFPSFKLTLAIALQNVAGRAISLP